LITCEICCTAVYEKVACSGDAIGAVLAGRLYETNAYSRSARGLRDRRAFDQAFENTSACRPAQERAGPAKSPGQT
jgi:hypothetical protein